MIGDNGVILVRELDERLSLSELMERRLTDFHRAKTLSYLWLTCCGS